MALVQVAHDGDEGNRRIGLQTVAQFLDGRDNVHGNRKAMKNPDSSVFRQTLVGFRSRSKPVGCRQKMCLDPPKSLRSRFSWGGRDPGFEPLTESHRNLKGRLRIRSPPASALEQGFEHRPEGVRHIDPVNIEGDVA